MEDYDQDWLNIYNDTEHSSGQDPLLDDIASCDTTTCDDEEARGGLLSFSLLIVGYFTSFFSLQRLVKLKVPLQLLSDKLSKLW